MKARICAMNPGLTVLLWACAAQLMAAEVYPTVRVRDIPEGLKMVWRQTKPAPQSPARRGLTAAAQSKTHARHRAFH